MISLLINVVYEELWYMNTDFICNLFAKLFLQTPPSSHTKRFNFKNFFFSLLSLYTCFSFFLGEKNLNFLFAWLLEVTSCGNPFTNPLGAPIAPSSPSRTLTTVCKSWLFWLCPSLDWSSMRARPVFWLWLYLQHPHSALVYTINIC